MSHPVFKDNLFAKKHVFCTGGSSGITLRVAEAFAEMGAAVSINGRNVEKLNAAVTGLTGKGLKAAGFAADVRDYAAVEKAIGDAVKLHGPIDVLVNGAAGNFPAPAAAMSSNGFKAVLDIDVLGTFNASRAAFEHLTKPGGVVLNISAPQASVPYMMQSHVCAAKAGVDMISRTLAMEWGSLGIRVNSISPGPIAETEGMERLAPDGPAKARVEQHLPLMKFGLKDDVANLAMFLASDAGRYITGSVCAVDGGMQLVGGAFMTLVMGA